MMHREAEAGVCAGHETRWSPGLIYESSIIWANFDFTAISQKLGRYVG
jgi:hypothetical protein